MTRFLDWLRSSRVPAEPLPAHSASFLEDHYAHYRRLPGPLRTTFERHAQRFLATKRITGVEMEPDDQLRLLVAASAATLSVSWPRHEWSEVTEVLLYPDHFDRDFTIGRPELAGLAHPWGTVILSVPALWHSFDYPDEPYHVGLHEFAHLLTSAQGIPVRLLWREMELWEAIQAHELKRVRNGESAVQMLGVLTEVEFFPSAVEAFFQKPDALKQSHRRLYRFLSRYFGQDPAKWAAAATSNDTPN